VHGDQLPPSRRHWKVEPLSEVLKEKSGVVLLDGSGGLESIVVSGAVLSTRRLPTVLVVEFPALSLATALTSYSPSETLAVSQLAMKGDVLSVPIVVHVEPPAVARSKTTC
jgi:hypothetical protein